MSYQHSTNLVFLHTCCVDRVFEKGAFIGAIVLLTAGHLWDAETRIASRNAYGYQAPC